MGIGETIIDYIDTANESSQTTPQEALLKSAKLGKKGKNYILEMQLCVIYLSYWLALVRCPDIDSQWPLFEGYVHVFVGCLITYVMWVVLNDIIK